MRVCTMGVATASAVLGIISPAAAQTIIPGGPVSGMWNAAGSPYIVQGNILVGDLLIEPGVSVLVDGPYELSVLVRLRVMGTAEAPVTVSSSAPNGWWNGIVFTDTGQGSEFNHCTISRSNNRAVRIEGASVVPPAFRSCTFVENTSPGHGGAMRASIPVGHLLVLESCVFRGNVVNPDQLNGSFAGGALYLSGPAVMTGCTFVDNRVNGWYAYAGSLYADGEEQLSLVRCTFRGGVTHSFVCCGSGLSRAGILLQREGPTSFTNCLIGCTNATGSNPNGSGVWIDSGDVSFVNCTIARNQHQGIVQKSGTVAVRNSILYFNNGGGEQVYGSVAFAFSNVQGGAPAGTGSISVNPAFKGLACDACQLGVIAVSPCVDAGDPDPAYNDACSPPSHGSPRNDIGAHGGPVACNWPYPSWCRTDCNDDCVLTIADFGCFQSQFVAGAGYADCNGDGALTIADFGCFQTSFVQGCP